MKRIFTLAVSCFALIAFAPAALSQVPDDNVKGLEAWSKIHDVFSHPRCASCHVSDGRPMWMGNGDTKPIKHPMFVGGNPDNHTGQPGAMCSTCHAPVNSAIEGGPPGAEVWLLAPKEMAWFGKSSAQICEQIKDPARNGGKTLAEVASHIKNDELVHSGWNPTPGREAAPYSIDATYDYFNAWIEAGAPCPAGE